MPNNWYHTPRRATETWRPAETCDNKECRSTNLKKETEYTRYWEYNIEHTTCLDCGYKKSEEDVYS